MTRIEMVDHLLAFTPCAYPVKVNDKYHLGYYEHGVTYVLRSILTQAEVAAHFNTKREKN
jgi:hypothetical protein